MNLEVGVTQRGFERIVFEDYNGVKCSLQVSSLATGYAVWFGCNEADPKVLVNGNWTPIPLPEDHVANTRMHLTLDQVRELLPYLKKFVRTGRLT